MTQCIHQLIECISKSDHNSLQLSQMDARQALSIPLNLLLNLLEYQSLSVSDSDVISLGILLIEFPESLLGSVHNLNGISDILLRDSLAESQLSKSLGKPNDSQ